MRRTVYKVFMMWNFDKEEKWLNEMAAKGLALVSVGACRYDFEDCAPGSYQVRLELLDNLPSHPESHCYIRFLEETGVEHVGTLLRWVYFRKQSTDAPFDLFSDIDSRIRHLNRMLWILGVLFGMNLINVANLLVQFITWEYSGTLVIVIVCALLLLLITYGFVRIMLKKNRLKRERRLHE